MFPETNQPPPKEEKNSPTFEYEGIVLTTDRHIIPSNKYWPDEHYLAAREGITQNAVTYQNITLKRIKEVKGYTHDFQTYLWLAEAMAHYYEINKDYLFSVFLKHNAFMFNSKVIREQLGDRWADEYIRLCDLWRQQVPLLAQVPTDNPFL